jgi:hypothetical protein
VTPLQRASTIFGLFLFVTITAGLIARRRWRLSWFFDAYVGFGLVIIPMVVSWPHLVEGYWAYTAWRPDSARVIAHSETLRKLQAGFSTCG